MRRPERSSNPGAEERGGHPTLALPYVARCLCCLHVGVRFVAKSVY